MSDKLWAAMKADTLVFMRATAFAAALLLVHQAAYAASPTRPPIASLYHDAHEFEDAITKAGAEPHTRAPVTGLIIPHHVLAIDLIGRAFAAAAGQNYDRVIVLSPDHFGRAKRPLATTMRKIDTVFGLTETDQAAVASLLSDRSLFEESDLFAGEHGVAVLLPFVKRLFPTAKIVPIAISYGSTRADWDRAFALLRPLVGPRTLVIQSTDFSHYLPPGTAIQRDQESLDVLAAGNPDGVLDLIQPDHVDSKGAFYLQLKVERALGSTGTVIANRNSVEYAPGANRTTSYVVAVYSPQAITDLTYDDQTATFFGGDIFTGRYTAEPLMDPAFSHLLADEVRAITKGAPLVLNLEGAVLDEVPANVSFDLHAMDESLTIPLLKALHVSAAGLANNHSFDLGAIGLESSASILGKSGIKPLRQGRIEDLGPFRVVALNFVRSVPRPGYPLTTDATIDDICKSTARPPLVAFVHWGREYVNAAESAETKIAQTLHRCGVSAIIGAHSHQATTDILAPNGGEMSVFYSLGNFLFDQSGPRVSGALLELRSFRQGTFATRRIAIPNLFEQGHPFRHHRT